MSKRVPLWYFPIAILVIPIMWFGRVFLKWNRLEKLEMVKLLVPFEDAVALYGEPDDREPSEKNPDATVYTFSASLFHEVSVTAWKGVIHSVTYWSSHASPAQDLACVMERYSQGQNWHPLTEGYLYQREDGRRRLWCSAMPAIGVATTEFLDNEKSPTDEQEDERP